MNNESAQRNARLPVRLPCLGVALLAVAFLAAVAVALLVVIPVGDLRLPLSLLWPLPSLLVFRRHPERSEGPPQNKHR